MPSVSTELLAVLHRLLDEALDLSPAERAAWLARLRAERPEHATEIERLLEQEGALDARRFLSGTAAAGTATLMGRRLGGWTLERPIGQGGMGTVWLARRSDGRFEGTAAVKLLNLALLDPVGAERFRREGTVLARLGHPGIARLLDAGVAEGGQPYLVLEHIEGERIDRYCDAGRLPADARIRLFLDVLAAVSHAHGNLIVHRDLKPSNILVTADGTVKLLDFGIAKLLEDEAAGVDSSTLTDAAGGRALTPEYAAPEQVTGGAITTATDVYSLGVLLYVLLAGRHPTGEGGRTPAEHFAGILDTVPPRLGAAVQQAAAARRSSSTERLRRQYAGDLENIVAKTLRKRPEERYGSVGAFAADLQRYLKHEPVTARADSLWYRTTKFVRRNRGPVTLGVLVAAALLAATVVAWTQLLAARRQRDEAVFHARRAEAIRDFQTALITRIGTTRVSLRELIDRGVALLLRRPPADPRVAAALLLQFADRYGELEIREEQRRLLALADSAASRSRDSRSGAALACAVAHFHTSQGRADSAHVALARAVSLGALDPGFDPETRAGCLLPAAELAYMRKQVDSAIALGRLAGTLLESARATNTVQHYVLLTYLANYLRSAGQVREAIALNQVSRDGLLSLGLEGTVLVASVSNDLSQILAVRGERRQALELLGELFRQTAEADPTAGVHPVIAFNYATELVALGALDSALAWYRAAAMQARERSSPEVERRALLGVARTSARLGRTDEARRAFRDMLAIAAAINRPGVRESLFVMATVHLAMGDTARAMEDYQAVLRQDGFYEGRVTGHSRAPLLDMTEVALRTGAPAQALAYARSLRALALVDSLAAVRSMHAGEANLLAARAHLALGARDSAAHYARAAVPALTVGAGADNPLTVEAGVLRDSLDP